MEFGTGDIYKVDYQWISFIEIRTRRTLVLLGVSDRVYEIYRGGRLDNLSSFISSGVGSSGEEWPLVYSAFGGAIHHAALRVTHDDLSLSTELHYESHRVHRLDANRMETVVVLKDKLKPFWVSLHYLAYNEEDVIEQWVEIRHEEERSVTLHEYPSVEVSLLENAEAYHLTTFYGLWERESSLQEERLEMGEKVLETRYGTWSSFDYNPSFLLSIGGPSKEECGKVLAGALAWSGAWKMRFNRGFGKLSHDVVERRRLSFFAGINPFAAEYHLMPEENFETPRMILTFTDQGKGEASRNLHRWGRRYGLRDGEGLRPVLLNSWEGAYFDFDERKLLSMMDGLSKMGGEMFVLDDGWFGNGKHARNSSNAGLGDWQVNREKLPHGLDYLVDAAHERGLKFGLWVEPEMVNRDSNLYEIHPEWVIQQPDRYHYLYRNQLVLDLSNPAVCEFVYESVAQLLDAHPGISYIKWDCNRSFTNMGSSYLTAEQQTHLWKDYVDGLYGVYRKLAGAYPEVIIQLCASGGGRVDYGALRHHHEFWPSDNTDALQRIFIQWGVSHIFPMMACAAHVSMCPNHQTGRSIPLKFRFDVAMSARMGLELNPTELPDDALAFVQSAVGEYKKIRKVVQHGELYRIHSPYDGDYASMMYLLNDRAVVFVYKIAHHLGQMMPVIKLCGLEDDATYRLEELNQYEGQGHCPNLAHELTGGYLMKKGIQVKLRSEYDSAVLLFQRTVS